MCAVPGAGWGLPLQRQVLASRQEASYVMRFFLYRCRQPLAKPVRL